VHLSKSVDQPSEQCRNYVSTLSFKKGAPFLFLL